MARVRFSGAVPSTIAENTVLDDWAATLALTGDLASLRAIELAGPAALAFSVRYDPALGVAFLSAGAAVDYEGLTWQGGDPTLAFTLRYFFADNTNETDPTTIRVDVTDIDDTPPQGLRFSSGGWIGADTLGGLIGTLAVDDPDTSGPFSFTVIDWDDWMFEFEGMDLRLRSGVNLGLDAIPVKPLIIDVWDGRQSAAFILDIQVRDPNEPPSATIIAPGQTIDGVTATLDGRALTLRESLDFGALPAIGEAARELTQIAASPLLVPGATSLLLPEGRVHFGAESVATRAALLHQATSGQAADGSMLAALVTRAEAGSAWTDIAADLLRTRAPVTDRDFLGQAYRAALGRDPDDAELAGSLAALAGDGGRARTLVELAFGAEAIGHMPDHPDGVWVAQPLGLSALPSWLADRGGIGVAPTQTALVDLSFL